MDIYIFQRLRLNQNHLLLLLEKLIQVRQTMFILLLLVQQKILILNSKRELLIIKN